MENNGDMKESDIMKALGPSIDSLASASSSNVSARDARRQRKRTAQAEQFPQPIQEVSISPDSVVNSVSDPVSPTSTSTRSTGRKKRSSRRAPNDETPRQSIDTGDRRGSRKQSHTNAIAIKSPGGDDQVILDPNDLEVFGDDNNDADALLFAMANPSRPLTPNRDNDVIIVQEKGHFRQGTRQDLEIAQTARIKPADQSYDIQTFEYQIAHYIKKIQLISLAVSYLAYGILAGLSLCSLIIFPTSTPSLGSNSEYRSLVEYSKAPFIGFFQHYLYYANGLSNSFTVVSIFSCVNAFDTWYSAKQSLKKVGDSSQIRGPISAPTVVKSATSERRARKRYTISIVLAGIAFLSFIINVVMICVDDVWGISTNTSDRYVTITGIQFGIGPYPLYPKDAFAELDTSQISLPWFWQYAAYALKNSAEPEIPSDLSFDLSWWIVCNIARASCGILSWFLALAEIRYRGAATPKKSI